MTCASPLFVPAANFSRVPAVPRSFSGGAVTPHSLCCCCSVLLADDKGHSASKHKDFIAKLSEFGTSVKCAEPVQAIAPGTASHAAPELMSKASELHYGTCQSAIGFPSNAARSKICILLAALI